MAFPLLLKPTIKKPGALDGDETFVLSSPPSIAIPCVSDFLLILRRLNTTDAHDDIP